jgi:DnaA regulatory inactivator Hda
MNALRQITLPFPEAEFYPADAFVPGAANHASLAYLEQISAWPSGRLVVWGEDGVGKTHFLHLAVARFDGAFLHPTMLRHGMSLPQKTFLALDDADEIGDAIRLLHLLNWCAEQGKILLLAARLAPAQWPVKLPDLTSRLRASLNVHLPAPDDALLRAILRRHVIARQLTLDSGVEDFLLSRLPRHGGALREAIAQLDRASLERHKPVTKIFASKILADFGADTVAQNPSPSSLEQTLL